MTPEEARLVAQFQMGTIIVLTHVFNCLYHRGVLPIGEAISSLEETERGLPADAAPATRSIIFSVVQGLRHQAAAPSSDPSKPPPPTRPDLRVIQGGRPQ